MQRSFAGVGRKLLATGVCLSIILMLNVSGLTQHIDDLLEAQHFRLLGSDIDSDVTIVSIDRKSLQALPDWPWSRDTYGDLVERLAANGARSVAFDIDFSAPGEQPANFAFAEAIEQSGMPVFMAVQLQALSSEMSAFVAEILPHPELGDVNYMAINYPIDEDGIVRRSRFSLPFSFGDIPTAGHALSGQPPKAWHDNEYYLDYRVSPDSFGRISFVDILSDQFDPDLIRNRQILVGATAPELGDEFALPAYGIQPGVLINAIAYETAVAGNELRKLDQGWIYVFAGVLWLGLMVCSRSFQFYIYISAQIVVTMLLLSAPLALMQTSDLLIETTVLHVVQMVSLGLVLFRELEERARRHFQAQMQWRDQHLLLQTLISENHEGFIVVNRYGDIEVFNDRAADLLALDTPPMMGANLKDVNERLNNQLSGCENQQGVIKQFEYQVDEASTLNITISRAVVPLAEHRFERRQTERVFVVIALHDISVQKQAELKEREAKETYQKLSAAKTQLINTMNHELRTPLNHIIGFSDLLKSSVSDDLQEHVNYINQSGNNLLDVLNDMLHAASLQAGDQKMDRDDINPKELVESAVSKTQARKNWHNQTVAIDIAPGFSSIPVDFSAMELALYHLLDNAAKFSGPDGAIQVSVGCTDGEAEIRVIDNGAGCASESIDNLTTMFFQADGSATRSHEGCGLGLFLVDQIVRLHGGTLALRTAPGEGFEAAIRVSAAGRSMARAAA